MRDLPVGATVLFIAIYIGASASGAIFAIILQAIGLQGFWLIFLAAFLAVPVGNMIRYGFGQFLADQSGHQGPQPAAFSFPIRMAIGAVVAAAVAYGLTSTGMFPPNAVAGSIAALVTVITLSMIFFLRFSLKE